MFSRCTITVDADMCSTIRGVLREEEGEGGRPGWGGGGGGEEGAGGRGRIGWWRRGKGDRGGEEGEGEGVEGFGFCVLAPYGLGVRWTKKKPHGRKGFDRCDLERNKFSKQLKKLFWDPNELIPSQGWKKKSQNVIRGSGGGQT